jgi:hypothetical protein
MAALPPNPVVVGEAWPSKPLLRSALQIAIGGRLAALA